MLGLDRQLLEPESAVLEVRDGNRACPAARVWGTLGLRLSAGHWLFLFASRDSAVVHKSVRSLDICPEASVSGPQLLVGAHLSDALGQLHVCPGAFLLKEG